jgi:co-chaperonin GroES (HSP10)
MVKPLMDWVLVKKDRPEEKSKGGIYVVTGLEKGPDSSRRTRETGTVLGVGPGRWESGILVRPQVDENARVVFLAGYETVPAPEVGDDCLYIHAANLVSVLPAGS